MPYKDAEKKRAYQREYKRRQREGNPVSNPGGNLQANPGQPGRKVYFYTERRSLALNSGIFFEGGFFITANLDLQARIEAHDLYGKNIFSWRVDP